MDRLTTEEVINKYKSKIERQMGQFDSDYNYSKSYETFKQDLTPKYTRYEKWCKNVGGAIKFRVSKKDSKEIQKYIDIAHLNITPSEAAGLALVSFLGIFLLGIMTLVSYWLLFTEGTMEEFPGLLLFLLIMISVFVYYYLSSFPKKLSIEWRLKASSQMVPAILYVVIYMKHTSNLEKAIAFAAQHLDDPLSSDFKKIFWDVEIGRFPNLKQSMDHYLEGWRGYFTEFIESFHLIESSLYESSEVARVSFLEKSLQVILDGVYEKMLKYTHGAKAPLTNVYMLGIVLPTLSLAIMPLAAAMLKDMFQWYHLVLMFNILIPFFVIFMTNKVSLERPGGYGETVLLENNPLYHAYKSKKPYYLALIICIPIFLIGALPLIWMHTPMYEWFGLPAIDPTWGEVGVNIAMIKNTPIFGIGINASGEMYGPISMFSLVLSILIPLSIALFFGIGNSVRTKKLILERAKYKEIESEFNSSLFQLGNRLGDGVPPEIAFSRVMESTKGTSTEGFFKLVNQNIQQLGMSLDNALFNPKRGALVFYPSHLIETSMRVLVESSKKGLRVAAKSLMSISEYVKNIKKINDRLTDLLADIISDMQSNMTFLAPLLSGVIVGLSGMISSILSNLSTATGGVGGADAGGSLGFAGMIPDLFSAETMIAPFWTQVIVGIYLIQVIFILTRTLVIIKAGNDGILATHEIAKNLKRGFGLYFIVALFSILGLGLIASMALKF